jgi:hypothetical protein
MQTTPYSFIVYVLLPDVIIAPGMIFFMLFDGCINPGADFIPAGCPLFTIHYLN